MDPLTATLVVSSIAQVGAGLFSSHKANKAQKKANKIQQQQLEAEQREIERQRQREIEQQKRENAQLMSMVSGLTNTAYAGANSPQMSGDKYGDMG